MNSQCRNVDYLKSAQTQNMDEDVYVFIISMDLEEAQSYKRIQGNNYSDEFWEAELYFAKKYNYPEVALSIMVKIDQAATKTDAALIAIRRGDYPDYIWSIMHLPDFEHSEVMETALNHRRHKTVARLATEEDLASAAKLGYEEGAQSIVNYIGLENTHEYELRDLIWIFDNLSLRITDKVLSRFLCNQKGTKKEFKEALELLTWHCSLEQIKELSNLHNRCLLTGCNPFGGDYLLFDTPENVDLVENMRAILDEN